MNKKLKERTIKLGKLLDGRLNPYKKIEQKTGFKWVGCDGKTTNAIIKCCFMDDQNEVKVSRKEHSQAYKQFSKIIQQNYQHLSSATHTHMINSNLNPKGTNPIKNYQKKYNRNLVAAGLNNEVARKFFCICHKCGEPSWHQANLSKYNTLTIEGDQKEETFIADRVDLDILYLNCPDCEVPLNPMFFDEVDIETRKKIVLMSKEERIAFAKNFFMAKEIEDDTEWKQTKFPLYD
jgi:hypothetical protein